MGRLTEVLHEWGYLIVFAGTVVILVTTRVLLGVDMPMWMLLAFWAFLFTAGFICVFVFQAMRFALSDPDERRKRLRWFETNAGRKAGWYVELEGRRLASLVDPRFEDMFWDSYRLEVLTADPEERQHLLSSREWWLRTELTYRNKAFDVVISYPFPSLAGPSGDGRVMIRSLYLVGPPITLFERLVLWLRRHWRGHEGSF